MQAGQRPVRAVRPWSHVRRPGRRAAHVHGRRSRRCREYRAGQLHVDGGDACADSGGFVRTRSADEQPIGDVRVLRRRAVVVPLPARRRQLPPLRLAGLLPGSRRRPSHVRSPPDGRPREHRPDRVLCLARRRNGPRDDPRRPAAKPDDRALRELHVLGNRAGGVPVQARRRRVCGLHLAEGLRAAQTNRPYVPGPRG